MSFLKRLLGIDEPAGSEQERVPETETVRKITNALDQLEPERARYIAAFAYLLSRVANADMNISPEETAVMERIVVERGDLPEEQADALGTHFSANPGLHVVKVILPYNGLWAVDFTHAGIDKAVATRELSRMISVDFESMVRFPHELHSFDRSQGRLGPDPGGLLDGRRQRLARERQSPGLC